MKLANNEISDVELVNRLTDGDTSIFTVFYDRYSRLIMHCIRSRTDQEADDLFQSFFIKLHDNNYKTLNGWDRQSRLAGYLSFIVKRFVIDSWRSGRTSKKVLGNLSDADAEKVLADSSLEPDFALERKQLRRRGIAAWAQLPSKRDMNLICGVFHRETPADRLAAAENLSPGAFRTALSRAKQRYLELLRLASPEYF